MMAIMQQAAAAAAPNSRSPAGGRPLAALEQDNQHNQRRGTHNADVMSGRLGDDRDTPRGPANQKSVCQAAGRQIPRAAAMAAAQPPGRENGESQTMAAPTPGPADSKISKRNSSTNNEHSSGRAKIVSGNQRRRRLAAAGPSSKAAGPFPSLPLCLVLFALSLFSSTTTTTLVNGIKLQPEGKEKFYWSGEQFVITCQNNNNIKNVKMRWTRPDGSPISEDRKERVHVESNGHKLVVTNTQLAHDDGLYTCTINEGPRVRESAEFNLKVLRETNFKHTPHNATLKAGAVDRVDCYVEFDQSVTTASVTWLKNRQPVDMLNDSTIHVLDYDPSRQLSSLQFSPVRREHADEYICRAMAVTPNLSKIIEFKINLETQFGPVFDAPEQTIWVESIQAADSRMLSSGQAAASSPGASAGAHHHPSQPATIPHRQVFGASNSRGRGGGRPRHQEASTEAQANLAAAQTGRVVRVELRCTCQANPSANILWFGGSRTLEITKGEPAHVLDILAQENSGHNVTSTLVVAYNLDPNWESRHDRYRCSASNVIDTAEKSFIIEQGNPPPAFQVGAYKSYSPETTVFNFTLLGPASSPSEPGPVGSLANIMPPVDSFRIRAESGPETSGSAQGGHQHQGHHHSQELHASMAGHAKRQSDQSVQWAYALSPEAALPLNMSVKLGHLRSGVQRLYLEAHNAVGFSVAPTYLGEYNLVSSAHAQFALEAPTLLILLAGQLTAFAGYLRATHSY